MVENTALTSALLWIGALAAAVMPGEMIAASRTRTFRFQAWPGAQPAPTPSRTRHRRTEGRRPGRRTEEPSAVDHAPCARQPNLDRIRLDPCRGRSPQSKKNDGPQSLVRKTRPVARSGGSFRVSPGPLGANCGSGAGIPVVGADPGRGHSLTGLERLGVGRALAGPTPAPSARVRGLTGQTNRTSATVPTTTITKRKAR
jgi:hypothetical protein